LVSIGATPSAFIEEALRWLPDEAPVNGQYWHRISDFRRHHVREAASRYVRQANVFSDNAVLALGL
jgi:hypothetical protein